MSSTPTSAAYRPWMSPTSQSSEDNSRPTSTARALGQQEQQEKVDSEKAQFQRLHANAVFETNAWAQVVINKEAELKEYLEQREAAQIAQQLNLAMTASPPSSSSRAQQAEKVDMVVEALARYTMGDGDGDGDGTSGNAGSATAKTMLENLLAERRV